MLKLPAKSFASVSKFLSEHKPLIYKYMVKQIRKGINNNLDKIDLFEMTSISPPHRHIATVSREEYPIILHDAIAHCVSVEDYETAALARDMLQYLDSSEITMLLNSNNQQE